MTEAPSTATPELNKALAKAQASMEVAEKDHVNPAFKSKYADLASVWAAIRKPLSDNGLAISHQAHADETGVTVTTALLHASGEERVTHLWLPVAQRSAHGYVAAITYGKRAGIGLLTGVVAGEADDDGNTASQSPTPPAPKGVAAVKAASHALTIKALCLAAKMPEAEISDFVNNLLQGKKQSEVTAADVETVKSALAERK